jgi:D-tyrosyl-tRNA(Tyr) deacylase
MRVVIQRVKNASVASGGERVASIGRGLLVLAGFAATDDEGIVRWMARKIASLRIFEDAGGKMNLGIDSVEGSMLVVSQFTLCGDCRKGKRPSFDGSAPPELAKSLYDAFVGMLREEASFDVQTGIFQAQMEVALVNDGPVTFVIEKEAA